MNDITETNITAEDIVRIEQEHPLMVLIAELSNRVDGSGEDIDTIERLRHATDTASTRIAEWSDAVGHLSTLASTHDAADSQTIASLGISTDMLGKLSMLTSMLKDFDYTLSKAAIEPLDS